MGTDMEDEGPKPFNLFSKRFSNNTKIKAFRFVKKTIITFYWFEFSLLDGKKVAKKSGQQDDTELECELDEILKNMRTDILAVGANNIVYSIT